MEEAVTERSSRFWPPKSCKEEVSLLERSKPKSTQYKDKWAVDVFRKLASCEREKISFSWAGSVFKGYDVHRMHSLEERFEDLDSLSQNFWLILWVSRGIHVTQMRPHNWLITSCIINEFEKYLSNQRPFHQYHYPLLADVTRSSRTSLARLEWRGRGIQNLLDPPIRFCNILMISPFFDS